MDTVIGIEKANNFCSWTREFESFIESSGFISFDLIKMIESDIGFSESRNIFFDWSPESFILSIIFYDDEFVILIVEL